MYHIGSTAPKYLKLFVTHKLDSAAIYEKDIDVAGVKEGWNTIALDSALTLTRDSIYLGYYFSSSSVATYAVANSSTIKSFIKKGVSADWSSTKGVAVYGTIVGDNLPAYDIVLSSDTLLNWDFKLDARGYRPQEVDKVLDIVINDYKTFAKKEKEYQDKIDELNKQILDLKHQLRNANENMQIFKASEKEITNLDLIKRVSQLEKIIYGKEE